MGDVGGDGPGQFSAMVIGAPRGLGPSELWRRGMAGLEDMGDAAPAGGGWLDNLTGGAASTILAKLDQVSFALKVSTAAAVGSALLSLWLSTRRRRD